MANFQLICDGTGGLVAAFSIQAQDASGNMFPATGSATIDSYPLAFLVQTGPEGFQIVPKLTLPSGAQAQTVTATFNLTDVASGIALPPLSVAVDLVGPPPAQKAVKVVVVTPVFRDTGSQASDPGSATISVSLN